MYPSIQFSWDVLSIWILGCFPTEIKMIDFCLVHVWFNKYWFQEQEPNKLTHVWFLFKNNNPTDIKTRHNCFITKKKKKNNICVENLLQHSIKKKKSLPRQTQKVWSPPHILWQFFIIIKIKKILLKQK